MSRSLVPLIGRRSVYPGPPRRVAFIMASLGLALLAAACGPADETKTDAVQLRPTASIQDIMLSVIDPAADAIWESVATIVTHDGTEERRPSTDEEWEILRHEAVRLLEASNLILMDGRPVARPGFESENPGIELEPEEIQMLIDEDREAWIRYTGDYYTVALRILAAVEAKDADRLFDEGGPLDQTCEGCHRHYWYPDDDTLRRIHEAEGRDLEEPSGVDVAGGTPSPATEAATGTIRGRVRLEGELPGNAVIRMGVDPLCAELTQGRRLVQQTVVTSPAGDLANVFVRLAGDFPEMPIPAEPVLIDQADCLFVPRVVGVRVGQVVQIRNSDPLLHNVDALGSEVNGFNVSQPLQGMVYETRFEPEEGMIRLRCDLHRWMTEYIGVVAHPWFAVTDTTGTFTLAGVPVGTHSLTAWHEEYGLLEATVVVEAGGEALVELSYPGSG